MKSNVKRFLSVVLIMVALFVCNPVEKASAGEPVADWNVARELVDGNWGPYATDWVKYHLDSDNASITRVDYTDPLGESKIWVNLTDENDGTTNPATLVIKYNPNTDKYEMNIKIYKVRVGYIDKPQVTNVRFIKVYWDNK